MLEARGRQRFRSERLFDDAGLAQLRTDSFECDDARERVLLRAPHLAEASFAGERFQLEVRDPIPQLSLFSMRLAWRRRVQNLRRLGVVRALRIVGEVV